MFGLPVEMITMLGSSVLGGVMTIWGQSIKAKQEEQKMLLARGKFQSVFLTWTEFSRGFLFLIEQKEMLVDRQYAGVVITPMDTHLMASIIGLYFGGSLVKK